MSLLVIDVGTSSVRAAIMEADASLHDEQLRPFLPSSPEPGTVEFDARALADTVLDVATAALVAHDGPVDAIGITNQRASTVVWDRATSEPVGPAIGWQDLRTIGMCLEQQAHGFRFAPNVSATKIAYLLDTYDPDRSRDLCFGTVDSWVTWILTEGAQHVVDATNAAITGVLRGDGSGWSPAPLESLRIPAAMLPSVVDSSGIVGPATALPGAPPIAALVGDQQASLLGQACVRPGPAKITFGTGGMLDMVLGPDRPAFETRGDGGTFPIITWRLGGTDTWGLEGIMLAAGTNVEWLRDDLGILETAEESDAVAQQCADAGGVVFVPAMLGLGTPQWDFGARGTVLGLTRGTGRPELVRAVLEGVAQRGADLVEAAETDGGRTIEVLRVDGGMSRNATFVQALADAAQKPVEVSPVKEATTLGAGFLAGLAVGTWPDLDALGGTWKPRSRCEPKAVLDRDRWRDAVDRARAWIPELSTVDF
ncbi:MAG TPA: FGGY family carbohydrate kinase [Acidimicrobiia bacterium]